MWGTAIYQTEHSSPPARPFHLRLELLIVCLLVFSAEAGLAKGKKVTIACADSVMVGELLSVRDTELVITSLLWESERQIRKHPESIRVLRLKDIDTIRLAGESHAVDGLKVGALVGLVVGAKIGSNEEPNPGVKAFSAELHGVLGMVPGLLAGALVGGFIVSHDETFDPADMEQMKMLREAARYPEEEPEFIADRHW